MSAEEPDALFGGRLRLFQRGRGAHRAGTDAVLLARLFEPEDGAHLLDVGAGAGVVGLAYAARTGCRVTLVERDPDLAVLARRNAELNRLAAVSVIAADVLASGAARREAGLVPDSADVVVTNPPFFESGAHRPSPNPERAEAHSFAEAGLDAWIRSCTGLLRPGGRIGLIHRADALPACLDALARRFGAVAIRPVHARAERPAIRALITGVKGSRAPIALLPALILQNADGGPTPEADALHRGEPWPRAAVERAPAKPAW